MAVQNQFIKQLNNAFATKRYGDQVLGLILWQIMSPSPEPVSYS